jgi:hypothetical protein
VRPAGSAPPLLGQLPPVVPAAGRRRIHPDAARPAGGVYMYGCVVCRLTLPQLQGEEGMCSGWLDL